MTRLAFLSLLFLAALSSFGQSIDKTKLDSLFNNLAANDLQAGSVAVAQNGKIIYQRSFGKDQTPATEYRIGSITKVFTAVLVYQLIDQKKLSLKDTLNKYFPQLPNAGKITIDELLGHRSGLANFTNNTNFDDWKEQPKTHGELLAFIKNQKTDFEPGAKADYNNSNYLLLGYIIEKIYHKPYKEVVTEKIIKKLGLAQTYYGDQAGFAANEAISYHYFNNEWKQDKAVFLDDFAGAGAIISTPQDMCRFITAIFAHQFISQASIDHMTHIEADGYGRGMFPYGDDAHHGFGHNGKTEGFGSSMQYYPENKLSIAYCTNAEIYPKAEILDDIFKICFNEPCTIPDFKLISLSKEQLSNYTGNYISDSGIRAATSFDGAHFMLETRGQKFTLDAISPGRFWNKPFGFFFDFDKNGKTLRIIDVDDMYELTRK
jgi:D-alanyl-D-alanine carboxypeptidase